MHFRICCATILVNFCPLKDFVMHRHITYYTQSTVCQGGFSNKFLNSSSWAYAGFAKGGQLLFGGGGACDAWHSHAFAKGVREHASPKKNFNGAIWCVLEHIFIFFLLSKSLKISFYTKIIINCSHVLARGSRSMVHSPLVIFY